MKIPKNILPSSTFAAGPAQGLTAVRNTKMKETFFERRHRTPFITEKLYKKTAENLKKLFNLPKDFLVIFYPGGATAAMDSVAWSLNGGSVAGLNLGAFSQLWNNTICASLPENIKKDFVNFDCTKPQSANKLNLKAKLILLTPNETSFGIALPDKLLRDIYKNKSKDTLVAWDSTSCAGARALPQAFDIMLFGPQKAFAAPAGTCVMLLNQKAVKRALSKEKDLSIPYFLNLAHAVKKAQIYQTLNTPCNTAVWAINKAVEFMLKNGGIKAMDKLTKKHAQTVLSYVRKSGWLEPLIKDKNFRSYETLTLKITDKQIKDTAVNKALKQTGKVNLIDGIEKYSTVKENSLRVGCFPFIDTKGTKQFEKLCQTLAYIYKQLKQK